MMMNEIDDSVIQTGVVGLGLMGSSITVALLLSGHPVIAIAPIKEDLELGKTRVINQLKHSQQIGLLNDSIESYLNKLIITEDFRKLKPCKLIVECVVETFEIKSLIYKKVESVVCEDAIIGSNTSAIPISHLQKLIQKPDRFLGIHWAEPAYATRFLEITCGEKTKIEYAEYVYKLAHQWKKEPTLLKKDIRGFITNRLMYAAYIEVFHQIEKGIISMEDADKAFRYDMGSWVTFMGIFKRMEYLGFNNYYKIIDATFKELFNGTETPKIMVEMVKTNAKGVHNLKGLYTYTKEEAKDWEKAFAMFNLDIMKLAEKYPDENTTHNLKK